MEASAVVQHSFPHKSLRASTSFLGPRHGRVYPVSAWHLGDGAQGSGSPFWDSPSCKGPRGQKDRGAPSEGSLEPDWLTGSPRVAQVGQPRPGEPSWCRAGSAPTGPLARNSSTLRRDGSFGNFPASLPDPTLAQQRPERPGQ